MAKAFINNDVVGLIYMYMYTCSLPFFKLRTYVFAVHGVVSLALDRRLGWYWHLSLDL